MDAASDGAADHEGTTCKHDKGGRLVDPVGISKAHLALCRLPNVDMYMKIKEERDAARETLTKLLLDENVSGPDKQHYKAEYNMKYGKIVVQCPRCWLMPGLCICERMQQFQPETKVVVHMHHSEWGRASNTGCLLPLSLQGCEMLIRGLKEHDQKVEQLLQDPHITTAILWPGEKALLPSELKQLARERTQGRIAVIAVDGTWDSANRMKQSYPADALHVRLTPDEALFKEHKVSLLNPLRQYRGDLANNGRVSTLEAVAALLYQLEGDVAMYGGLLNNCKIKVDAVQLQKNRQPVYNTTNSTTREQYAGFPTASSKGLKRAKGHLVPTDSTSNAKGCSSSGHFMKPADEAPIDGSGDRLAVTAQQQEAHPGHDALSSSAKSANQTTSDVGGMARFSTAVDQLNVDGDS